MGDCNELLRQRFEYLKQLDNDIDKNLRMKDETTDKIQSLESVRDNIKSLGEQPEKEAFIPLSTNVYMKGRIIHTGEYFVEKKAYPDSYVALQTLEQTVQHLDTEISESTERLSKINAAIDQLGGRKDLLIGNTLSAVGVSKDAEDSGVTDDMPQEIRSDKGVAVKVGGFYEILEFET